MISSRRWRVARVENTSMNLLDYFKTGSDRSVKSDDPAVIRREFEWRRWSVFLSVTFGYAFFYVARINLAVVKKPLMDEGVFSASELGVIGSVLFIVYAFGKLFNGFLSDRANIRRFMSAALLCAAVVNFLLGFVEWFWAFVILWAINGWFQSIGSAPSVVALSQWFTKKEMGTRYGVWSVSHSIGQGATYVFTAVLVSAFGWRWGFWGPGLICAGVALILFRTLADRPQTYGLPSVNVYKGEADVGSAASGSPASVGKSQLAVLKNPAIWILGFAGAANSITRYGVTNWGILFLQETKNYSLTGAGSVLAAFPIAAMAGSILGGYISDRFFGGRRNVPTLVMSIFTLVSLIGLAVFSTPNVTRDIALIAVFGFNMGGLVTYLGGLMAVDLSSKKAAGAAMGVIGMFCYIGASAQEAISGVLIDAGKSVSTTVWSESAANLKASLQGLGLDLGNVVLPADSPVFDLKTSIVSYDFKWALMFWIGATAVALLLTLLVWKAKPAQDCD